MKKKLKKTFVVIISIIIISVILYCLMPHVIHYLFICDMNRKKEHVIEYYNNNKEFIDTLLSNANKYVYSNNKTYYISRISIYDQNKYHIQIISNNKKRDIINIECIFNNEKYDVINIECISNDIPLYGKNNLSIDSLLLSCDFIPFNTYQFIKTIINNNIERFEFSNIDKILRIDLEAERVSILKIPYGETFRYSRDEYNLLLYIEKDYYCFVCPHCEQ